MEQIAEDIHKLNQFKVELKTEGKEPNLSKEIKLGFFRIAPKTLNNIRKHSKADKAIIRRRFQKNFLSMAVSDNGIGFNANAVSKKTGEKVIWVW